MFHRRCMFFNVFSIVRITRKYCGNNVPFNNEDIHILGIETSCDDTGVAIVDKLGNILGETLYSQSVTHLRYGGVNPIIARELHRNTIESAVEETLNKATLNINNINAFAVTVKPGLPGSLHIGVKYAKFLAKIHKKPLIPIHHMEAHALIVRIKHDVPFPFLVLLISGGHCLLAIANDINDFILLGESMDNAPGEILDKVARRLKLRNIPAYSKMAGGKAVEMAASKATNIDMFKFPNPLWKFRDCNFSFSGLKDSLERKLKEKEREHGIIADEVIPEVYNLCAAFQLTIAEHIALRTERAILFCEQRNLINNYKNIVVSGGVACNNFIFESIKVIGDKHGYNVIRPPRHLCTDNGVMIAWNGVEKYKRGCDVKNDISTSEIEPKAPFGKNLIRDVMAANIHVKKTKLKNIYNLNT